MIQHTTSTWPQQYPGKLGQVIGCLVQQSRGGVKVQLDLVPLQQLRHQGLAGHGILVVVHMVLKFMVHGFKTDKLVRCIGANVTTPKMSSNNRNNNNNNNNNNSINDIINNISSINTFNSIADNVNNNEAKATATTNFNSI
jgi:hypothetical protein